MDLGRHVRVAKQASGWSIVDSTLRKLLGMLFDEIHLYRFISPSSPLKHVVEKIHNVGKRITAKEKAIRERFRPLFVCLQVPGSTYRKIPLSEASTSTRGRPSSSNGIKS